MAYQSDSEEWKLIHSRWKQQMLKEEKAFKVSQQMFLAKQQANKKRKKRK